MSNLVPNVVKVGVQIPEGEAGAAEVARHISTPAMRGTSALDLAYVLAAEYNIDLSKHTPDWLATRKRQVAVEQVRVASIFSDRG